MPRHPHVHRTNVPVQRDPSIGRDRELEDVRNLLLRENVGLVTLTGPGGTGKTRLALQVASDVLDRFPDGSYVVPLASIRQSELIVSTVAHTLSVQEAGDQSLLTSLQAYLRHKRLLLILDNFEHLLNGAPVITELLATSPGLTVLVTSRAALHLTGEHEFPVPPLALPDLRQPAEPEALAETPAVALFLGRARAVRPDFALTDENARVVAEICVRLDGLPLAIELAAARMKLLSPQALLARLSHRLQVLTSGARDVPARQRTLRDTIAWSYDLLTTEERRLFQRLAVFAGGFTLAAAEAVADTMSTHQTIPGNDDDPTMDVLDALASLVDKSLLRQAAGIDDEPRFEMLETIREYTAERLEASGEAGLVHRCHALYYLGQAEAAEQAMLGGPSVGWLATLEEEHDNLRAALQWCIGHDEPDLALRLAGGLAWFWYDHGHLSEGRSWLTTTLDAAATAPPSARAKALIGAGGLAHRQYELESAVEYLHAGLSLSRESGDRRSSALAIINLGLVAHDQGDYTRARQLHEESLALYRQLEHPWGVGLSLSNLGWAELFMGNTQRARSLAEEALALRRELDDTLGVAYTLYTLGRVALDEHDMTQTRELLTESLTLFRMLGDRWGLAACLESLAIVSASGNDGEDGARRAARLWGTAEALRETIGAPLTPTDHRVHRRHQDSARASLDPEDWDAAWTAGRSLPLDDVLAGITQESSFAQSPPDDVPARSYPAGLTEREVEVLALVSEGLSNAEVAARLHLSPRTIGQHLRSIYSKLGVSSRAAATRFAVEHRLR